MFLPEVARQVLRVEEPLGAVAAFEDLHLVRVQEVAAQLRLGREPHLALHALHRLPAAVDLAGALHVVAPGEHLVAVRAGMVLRRRL